MARVSFEISRAATGTAREASLTCTMGAPARGESFTAVCTRDVVAPPIKTGVVIPRRFISSATSIISSKEGVIRPLKPMMSAPSRTASSKMRSLGTITPRSITLNPFQARTTPTMFLPMSWTSPLTVASKTVPAPVPVLPDFSSSRKGLR